MRLRLACFALALSACSSPASSSGDDSPDSDAASGDASTADTQFGVRLEPPRGRVIHGMGQWDLAHGNPAYIAALDDPALAPAIGMMFFSIDTAPRPFGDQIANLRSGLAAHVAAGRIPQLNIHLRGIWQPQSPADLDPNDPYFGLDDEIATTTTWDANLREIAHAVRDTQATMFVRIGGEFSGYWEGMHPGLYPIAFRKVVDLFRTEGATNAVFVWCYEPAAAGDFAAEDDGMPRWYPGDDVVDWFGIDVFGRNDFVGNAKTDAFLAMAVAKQKPVIVAESSAAFVELTPAQRDGEADWDAWYAPYFAWIAANPVIEAFQYISVDWSQIDFYAGAGWKNANIATNTTIRDRFVTELRAPRYLHAGELHLVAH